MTAMNTIILPDFFMKFDIKKQIKNIKTNFTNIGICLYSSNGLPLSDFSIQTFTSAIFLKTYYT